MFVCPPWSQVFCSTDLVSSKQVAQMYEEEIHFGNLLPKQSETVLAHLTPVTLTIEPVTPNSIGFFCYCGWMWGPSLRKVGQGVFQILIGNKKVTARPTDWHVQSNMHSDKNCWTLLIWKNNSGVPETIYLVIFIGWDILSLRIVTKFQEDLVRIVWLRERTNLAAIHGCSHIVAFFKWAYNQRNITQHVDL